MVFAEDIKKLGKILKTVNGIEATEDCIVLWCTICHNKKVAGRLLKKGKGYVCNECGEVYWLEDS